MLTIQQYLNPKNERKYVIGYGEDLFGNHVVMVRYGIALGICKSYLFGTVDEQLTKVADIERKRLSNGYRRIV